MVTFASSPADIFPFCRTQFLKRFAVVVTGGGVGQVHHPFSCLVQGHDFSVQTMVFQRAPRNPHFSITSLFDHPRHNFPIKGSRFPSLSIMIPPTQSVRHLPRCLPNGILSFDIFHTTPRPFPRLLSLIVLAGWSCQNDHCHGRPPGK